MRHPAHLRRDAELVTPYDVLDAAERAHELDALAQQEEDLRIMGEVALDWLGWIFEGGPELVRVVERVNSLALEYIPAVHKALPAVELQRCFSTARSPAAVAAFAAAERSNGHLVNKGRMTPFPFMQAREFSRHTPWEIVKRERGLIRWLKWLFEEGTGLLTAVKRVYSQARACRAELVWNMSGEQISDLFGQVRATESARTIRVTEGTLLAGGCRFTAMPYQKSAEASDAYAKAQRGNNNRAKKAA